MYLQCKQRPRASVNARPWPAHSCAASYAGMARGGESARAADRHPARHQSTRTSAAGRNSQRRRRRAARPASAPHQAMATANPSHRSASASSGAEPALQQPLGHERTADERQRRPDQLHDFDLVAAGVQSEPDDGGHGHGGRHGHQHRQREPGRRGPCRGPTPSRASHSRSYRTSATPGSAATRRTSASARPSRSAPGRTRTSTDAGNGLSSKPLGQRRELGELAAEPRQRLAPSRRTRGPSATPLWSISASIAPRCSEVASSRR